VRHWPRPLTAALDVVDHRGEAIVVRLVRYTGKRPHFFSVGGLTFRALARKRS
jgi:hypothetical protein